MSYAFSHGPTAFPMARKTGGGDNMGCPLNTLSMFTSGGYWTSGEGNQRVAIADPAT
jgi:hypothetical protein